MIELVSEEFSISLSKMFCLGRGWSGTAYVPPNNATATVQAIVTELNNVTIASGAKAPFGFIGHGLGGLLGAAYAAKVCSQLGASITNLMNVVS
jgi:hypothetical protein